MVIIKNKMTRVKSWKGSIFQGIIIKNYGAGRYDAEGSTTFLEDPGVDAIKHGSGKQIRADVYYRSVNQRSCKEISLKKGNRAAEREKRVKRGYVPRGYEG